MGYCMGQMGLDVRDVQVGQNEQTEQPELAQDGRLPYEFMPVTNWGRKPNGAEMVQYDAPMFFSFTEHSLLHQYPNMRAECHWHIDFEFTHIIRGHMWYFVNGESIRLEEGQGIFVNSRQLHYGFTEDGTDCEFSCTLLNPSCMCMPQAQRTLDAAMATTLDAATADMKQSHIAVVSSDSEDDGTTPGSSAFAGTLKTGLYPLLLVMPVCTFLVVSTFNDNEIRRRLYSSPARLVSLEAQQMLTCGTFGLLVCAAYTAVTFLLMALAGVSFTGLNAVNVGLSFVSLMVYTLMAIACGFLLGSSGFNEMATNGFVNVFALLVMFTSGMAFPVDMMPDPMIIIGKLLPGWWLCSSIDHVFGLGTASSSGVDYGAWASSTGLVAMFAVAFICLGLALGRIRRARPTLASPATTQLAK